MKHFENLNLDAHFVSTLETAINRWLAARGEYQKQASRASEYDYNATYFALG